MKTYFKKVDGDKSALDFFSGQNSVYQNQTAPLGSEDLEIWGSFHAISRNESYLN